MSGTARRLGLKDGSLVVWRYEDKRGAVHVQVGAVEGVQLADDGAPSAYWVHVIGARVGSRVLKPLSDVSTFVDYDRLVELATPHLPPLPTEALR